MFVALSAKKRCPASHALVLPQLFSVTCGAELLLFYIVSLSEEAKRMQTGLRTLSAGKRWRDVGLGLTKVFSGESHKR